MKRLALFSILTLILLSSTSAFADISLDNYRERLDITPGEEIQGTIAVRNFGTTDVVVKAYPEDFIYTYPFDGKKEFNPIGANPYSCKDWITLLPAEFTLPAAQMRNIAYIIKVPEDAKGGYCTTIIFEDKRTENQGGTGLVLRVGRSLLLETKGAKKDLKVKNLTTGEDTIKGDFYNSGELILVSKPVYTIVNSSGATVARGELQEFYLPVGEKASFKLKVPNKVPVGTFTLELNFSFSGKGALLKDLVFSKDEAGQVMIVKAEE